MKITSHSFFEELFRNDKAGERLFAKALGGFQDSRADRLAFAKAREEARRLCNDIRAILNEGAWTQDVADMVKKRLGNITVDTKCPGASKDYLELYRRLGFLSDYTSNHVAIRYPQAAANPAALRSVPADVLSNLEADDSGDDSPSEMARHIAGEIKKAQKRLGMSPSEWTRHSLDAHWRASHSNFLAVQQITGTAVYFNGPLFYADTGDRWSLTFSTGSGLPDPLEWHGSRWFSKRYNVPMSVLRASRLAKKNPIRPINFQMGIVNDLLPVQRLYVWQRDKTSSQLRTAYALAYNAGHGQRYLKDAWNQLTRVFDTRRLKIIELEHFDRILTEWTRISPRHILTSLLDRLHFSRQRSV